MIQLLMLRLSAALLVSAAHGLLVPDRRFVHEKTRLVCRAIAVSGSLPEYDASSWKNTNDDQMIRFDGFDTTTDNDDDYMDEDQATVDRKRQQVQERLLAQQQQAASSTSSSVSTFELTLTKPLGFSVGDCLDSGTVQVTAIQTAICSKQVLYGVQVGDRIVAMDSSLGDRMWPVSTTAGVISACTSRLPGQSITFRFERSNVVVAGANLNRNSTVESSTVVPAASRAETTIQAAAVVAAVDQEVRMIPTTSSSSSSTIQQKAPLDRTELIRRCRSVLKRYMEHAAASSSTSSSDATTGAAWTTKFNSVPALVADKVVDALAAAGVAIDCVTLGMIMKAYLMSHEHAGAMRVFEMATGFSADGSSTPLAATTTTTTTNDDGRRDRRGIVPSESVLNLITGTTLMRAHGLANDMGSVLRVLAALEGRSGEMVHGLEVAPWPWTGSYYGTIQPDTVCYNIALAAAERTGSLETALDLFARMRAPNDHPNNNHNKRPVRNVVTYNTLISALCHAGRSQQAFEVLDDMTRVGARPDKYTYTSLIPSCWHDGDVQELLYDMKEKGAEPDVVLYNTVIRTLCEKRHWTAATKLITEMESRGIQPDSMTYSFLMNTMLAAGKPSACLTLFESACASDRSQRLVQHVHLYTTAITAACQLRNHERALDLVKRMSTRGVKPNLQTLTAVMGACLACEKYEFAVQVYDKIDAPDGYAMAQGLRALVGVGALPRAVKLVKMAGNRSSNNKRRLMSGKELMQSYQTVLSACLQAAEYDLARDVLQDLLTKGFIPNKAMLYSVIDAFDIKRSSILTPNENDRLRFQFLMFVLDALQRRNLAVDGTFYAATLHLARQLGGVERRIGTLLARAKTYSDSSSKELVLPPAVAAATTGDDVPSVVDSWERLLLLLLSDVDDNHDDSLLSLPTLSVRVASRDATRVLQAEQSVASKSTGSRRTTSRTMMRPFSAAAATSLSRRR